MTKDDRTVIDQMRGYVRAKSESGKNETFPEEQITAISQSLFIYEKEIHSPEYHSTVQAASTDAVRETLRKYIEKNRRLENKKKLDAMEIDSLTKKLREKTYPIDREHQIEKSHKDSIQLYQTEIKEKYDKIGLQQIEIGKLGGLLKEADDKIIELEQTLERVRTEVVSQTARDNEEKNKRSRE